jgi:hypothetical protein
MRKCWLAVLITLGLGAIALTAADFWQSKKFTEWSDKEVQKILRDSPWARPVEVRLEGMGGGGMSGGGRGGRGGRGGGGGGAGGSPGGAGGEGMGGAVGTEGIGGRSAGESSGGFDSSQAPPTQTVIVRWHTALPIKQAVVRARYKDEAANSPEAAKILSRLETEYVVGVTELPPQLVRGNPAQLKSNAVLKIKGRPPIPADNVQAGRGQRGADLYLFFPKAQPGSHLIALEDGEVEVELKLGSTNIRRKFRLKDMVFDGKLEI